MVNKYTLVNPIVKGKVEVSVDSDNCIQAAKTIYRNLSQHFSNNIPHLHITLQKGGEGGKLSHFKVSEKRTGENVTFKISRISDVSSKNEKQFLKRQRQALEKVGGRSLDDSDDDDSDDVFYKSKTVYVANNTPLSWWWYDPYLYNLDTVFIPTFYSSVVPYIEIPVGPIITYVS